LYTPANAGSSYIADPIWKANDSNNVGVSYDFSLDVQ
jgi:hypothetical protein